MIAGALSKRKVKEEPVEVFMKRELANSMFLAARRNDPLFEVSLKVRQVDVAGVSPNENIVVLEPEKMLEQLRTVNKELEAEVMKNVDETKTFVATLRASQPIETPISNRSGQLRANSFSPSPSPHSQVYTPREDEVRRFCQTFNSPRELATSYLEAFQSYDEAVSYYMIENGMENAANRPR